jgi:Helix-turn-helix domain
MDEELLSIRQAALLPGSPRESYLYDLVRGGRLPALKKAGRIFLRRKDLARFLETYRFTRHSQPPQVGEELVST